MEKTIFSTLVAEVIFGIITMLYLGITDFIQVNMIKSVDELTLAENIRMIFCAVEFAVAYSLIRFLFKDLRKEAKRIYGK